MSRGKGFTLIELMIVIAIIAIIAATAIPALISAQRAGNERSSTVSLKNIVVAEFDFRNNDRDNNKIQDFWTGDAAGLYSMTSATFPGNADAPLKLVDQSVAASDSAPLAAGAAGGEYAAIGTFATQSPKAGYWVAVLDSDVGAGEDYQQDTGGTPAMGPVHHAQRFGFIAFPDGFGQTGKIVSIINESSVIYRQQPASSIKPSASVPPGAVTAAGFKDWPADAGIKSNWTKLD